MTIGSIDISSHRFQLVSLKVTIHDIAGVCKKWHICGSISVLEDVQLKALVGKIGIFCFICESAWNSDPSSATMLAHLIV